MTKSVEAWNVERAGDRSCFLPGRRINQEKITIIVTLRGIVAVGCLLLAFVLLLPRVVKAAAGDLDTTFNSPNGYLLDAYPYADNSALSGLALQSDGSIIATGSVSTGNASNMMLMRVTSDGVLDSTFGTGGYVPNGYALYLDQLSSGIAVSLQPDGKIVVAGTLNKVDLALWRYNSNGTIDTGFGTGGLVVFDNGGYETARAVIIQPDGKYIIAGNRYVTSETAFLLRYNSNGTLDTGFGTSGVVTYSNPAYASAEFYAVTLQPDGKIIVTGNLTSAAYTKSLIVRRYNSNGTADTGFGSGGSFISAGSEGYSVAVQPDGKLVAGGSKVTSGVTSNCMVMRLEKNGSLDAGFGSAGVAVYPDPGNTRPDMIFSVALDPAEKIVATGFLGPADGSRRVIVMRFNANGTLDTGFGSSGAVMYPGDANSFDSAKGVVIQSDGKIVVAGSVLPGLFAEALFMRLLPNYYTIATPTVSTGGCDGFISCAPDPVWEGGDSQCAIVPNSGCYTKTLRITQAISYYVDPVWSYSFPNVNLAPSIQATFAPATLGLYQLQGHPATEQWQKTDDTFSAAFTDAAALDSDLIKVLSGAYYNLAGVTCSSIGNAVPTFSGGWSTLDARGTNPTLIATKFTISGSCSLIIDGITIQ